MIKLEPLPPAAAIRAFRARGNRLQPTFAWQDVWQDLHASMFTVAKSTGHNILDDIFEALLRALDAGTTVEAFMADLEPLLRDKGWLGRTLAADPDTGEQGAVQLGSPRRLKLIFDVNTRVSYAAGHWDAFERRKSSRPFLRYVAVLDERTRDQHRAFHNLVLPVDHPFWNIFAPPNGWNCRCTLQQLSQRDLDRLIAQGEQLRIEPPQIEFRDWLNKRTGLTEQVPVGVDPGWAYNPGKSGHEVIEARIREHMADIEDKFDRN